jgi:nuclear inhibitor of protein phosphatase 1
VKSAIIPRIYSDLCGDSVPAKVGSSWAYKLDDQHVEEKTHSMNLNMNSTDESDNLSGDS